MMGFDIARALNPSLLAIDCGIDPDPWQDELLGSKALRMLLLCARQTGKTTVASLMGLSTAFYMPNSLTLIVSPSQRQSAEVQRTVMTMHGRLSNAPKLHSDAILRAEFDNGSRIIALPGSERTVRGYAGANLVIIDEAARVDDALIAAVRPMLATSNGKLVALTTPAGKRGWFYESWTSSSTFWLRTKVFAQDCPRISAAFLAEELYELGPQLYSQEYGLEFVDDNAAVFPVGVIENAFTRDVRPLWQ